MGLFAVGPLIGEKLLHLFRDVHLTFGPLVLDQYRCIYVLCGLVMLPATFGALLFLGRGKKTTAPSIPPRQTQTEVTAPAA